MATAAQEWSNSNRKINSNQPEPVITYDHMSDPEPMHYFRMEEKTTQVSILHLVIEEILLVLLAATMLILVL